MMPSRASTQPALEGSKVVRNATAMQRHTWMAQLRSHELQIKLVYRLRLVALGLAAFTILIGAVMVFAGLQGYINWVVEAPHSINAKLTNASPGIVFATIGMILGFVVVLQRPVRFQTDGTGGRVGLNIR
jgi:hypothetical protein